MDNNPELIPTGSSDTNGGKLPSQATATITTTTITDTASPTASLKSPQAILDAIDAALEGHQHGVSPSSTFVIPSPTTATATAVETGYTPTAPLVSSYLVDFLLPLDSIHITSDHASPATRTLIPSSVISPTAPSPTATSPSANDVSIPLGSPKNTVTAMDPLFLLDNSGTSAVITNLTQDDTFGDFAALAPESTLQPIDQDHQEPRQSPHSVPEAAPVAEDEFSGFESPLSNPLPTGTATTSPAMPDFGDFATSPEPETFTTPEQAPAVISEPLSDFGDFGATSFVQPVDDFGDLGGISAAHAQPDTKAPPTVDPVDDFGDFGGIEQPENIATSPAVNFGDVPVVTEKDDFGDFGAPADVANVVDDFGDFGAAPALVAASNATATNDFGDFEVTTAAAEPVPTTEVPTAAPTAAPTVVPMPLPFITADAYAAYLKQVSTGTDFESSLDALLSPLFTSAATSGNDGPFVLPSMYDPFPASDEPQKQDGWTALRRPLRNTGAGMESSASAFQKIQFESAFPETTINKLRWRRCMIRKLSLISLNVPVNLDQENSA